LITGSTDGIGLYTAKLLAKSSPNVADPNKKRLIFIHGRNP
jgi:NAD(P)-dependent dehydrogenase (short-subunit alcohol dehydrogenase family)